jgi:hypothetical protein
LTAVSRPDYLTGRLQINLSGYWYEYKNYNQWLTAYQCRIPQYDRMAILPDVKLIAGEGTSLDYIENSYGPLSPGGARQHGGNVQVTWMITANDIFSANAS